MRHARSRIAPTRGRASSKQDSPPAIRRGIATWDPVRRTRSVFEADPPTEATPVSHTLRGIGLLAGAARPHGLLKNCHDIPSTDDGTDERRQSSTTTQPPVSHGLTVMLLQCPRRNRRQFGADPEDPTLVEVRIGGNEAPNATLND